MRAQVQSHILLIPDWNAGAVLKVRNDAVNATAAVEHSAAFV